MLVDAHVHGQIADERRVRRVDVGEAMQRDIGLARGGVRADRDDLARRLVAPRPGTRRAPRQDALLHTELCRGAERRAERESGVAKPDQSIARLRAARRKGVAQRERVTIAPESARGIPSSL